MSLNFLVRKCTKVTHSAAWLRVCITLGSSSSQTRVTFVVVAGSLSRFKVFFRNSFTSLSRSFVRRFEIEFVFWRNSKICAVWKSNRSRIIFGKNCSQVSTTSLLDFIGSSFSFKVFRKYVLTSRRRSFLDLADKKFSFFRNSLQFSHIFSSSSRTQTPSQSDAQKFDSKTPTISWRRL